MEVEFMIRLDKFLSEMGVGTRQEVKQYIRKGKVEVDGEIAKRPELKVDETKANVTLDGERIGYASYVYYMLNKPSGVVSATEDKREKTVIDLINSIGEVTADSETVISSARSQYDALPDSTKANVTNYDVLVAAEASLAQIKAAGEQTGM